MEPCSTRTMKMHQQVLHCAHRAIGFFVCSTARGHYTAMSCFVPDCSAAYIDGPVLAHIHGTFGGGGKVLDSTDNPAVIRFPLFCFGHVDAQHAYLRIVFTAGKPGLVHRVPQFAHLIAV